RGGASREKKHVRPRVLVDRDRWTRQEDWDRLAQTVELMELEGAGSSSEEALIGALQGCGGLMRVGRRGCAPARATPAALSRAWVWVVWVRAGGRVGGREGSGHEGGGSGNNRLTPAGRRVGAGTDPGLPAQRRRRLPADDRRHRDVGQRRKRGVRERRADRPPR